MLRPIATLAAFVFVVVFVVGALGYSSCKEIPKHDSEAAKAEETYEKHCSTFALTLKFGFAEVGEFVHAYHDEVNAVSTVVIAIFTVVLGLFTINLSRSTKIAAEHIPKVERSYIFAEPWDIDAQSMPDKITVGISVVNHGKTPGTVQKVYGEFSTTEPRGKPVYLHGESRQLYIPIKGNSGPNPVYLHVRFVPPISDYNFFFGYIEYVDIFRVVQTSRFCAKVSTYEGIRQWEIAGPSEWNEWT
jgi:hypothetical protein